MKGLGKKNKQEEEETNDVGNDTYTTLDPRSQKKKPRKEEKSKEGPPG